MRLCFIDGAFPTNGQMLLLCTEDGASKGALVYALLNAQAPVS